MPTQAEQAASANTNTGLFEEDTYRTRQQSGRQARHKACRHPARPLSCALISSNLARARSNLSLNSHIASRISRKVAEVLARSALPKVNMLLLRKYPMTVGPEMR